MEQLFIVSCLCKTVNCIANWWEFFHLYAECFLTLFAFVFQGQQLKVIEEEVLEQLVEQIKLRSENVISDLEKATAELKAEPQDLHDFSKYTLMV